MGDTVLPLLAIALRSPYIKCAKQKVQRQPADYTVNLQQLGLTLLLEGVKMFYAV